MEDEGSGLLEDGGHKPESWTSFLRPFVLYFHFLCLLVSLLCLPFSPFNIFFSLAF